MKIQISHRFDHLDFFDRGFQTAGHLLRRDWPHKEIEGMICHWELTDEFVAFKGPKVFYCCEPTFYFGGLRQPKRLLRRRLASLREDEFAWHYHPSETMRVFHHTELSERLDRANGVSPMGNGHQDVQPAGVPKSVAAPRKAQAVTVVGNLGRPYLRNRGRQRRLTFIVESGGHIYGPEGRWMQFRLHTFSRTGPPPGYQGGCRSKPETLSQYHACICLENTCEPLYFTEKFLDSVRAGCVPIYHAHPTVKSALLEGARWVDPADYGWDGRATVAAALKLDRREVDQANQKWLCQHPRLHLTTLPFVYSRLAEILALKAVGKINLPQPTKRTSLSDEC
jgi:hypothetical protein